jgi:hypothetical protein
MTEGLLLLAGGLLIGGGVALRVAGLVGVRRHWLVIFVGEVFWTVQQAAYGSLVGTCFSGAAATLVWFLWRHSDDDDDDRWRRLLAWGRSKLPRPVIVRLRPALEGR